MKSRSLRPEENRPLIGEGLLPTEEPDRKRGPQFLKLSPNSRATLICLSPVWTGAITHYYGRRMHLHLPHDCPFCANKSEQRFYAWLHVCDDPMDHQFILQLPSSARPLLSKQHDMYGTLRGCFLTALREGKHANTPTTIIWRSPPNNTRVLPDAIDIKEMLLTLMSPGAKKDDVTPNADQTDPEASEKKGS